MLTGLFYFIYGIFNGGSSILFYLFLQHSWKNPNYAIFYWMLLAMAVFGLVNPRRACAARVTAVGFVCLSVTLHLTSRTSVRPRNDTIYPTGDEGQKICGVFSENAPLQSWSASGIVRLMRSRPFYPCGRRACAYNYFQQALTSTGSACSVYLEGTRSHNEGRVSTLACCLLL